jgi:hypothetical protein
MMFAMLRRALGLKMTGPESDLTFGNESETAADQLALFPEWNSAVDNEAFANL